MKQIVIGDKPLMQLYADVINASLIVNQNAMIIIAFVM